MRHLKLNYLRLQFLPIWFPAHFLSVQVMFVIRQRKSYKKVFHRFPLKFPITFDELQTISATKMVIFPRDLS